MSLACQLARAHDQMVDISSPSSYVSQGWVDLGWNRMGDISPLSKLSNAAVLSLGENEIGEFSRYPPSPTNWANSTYMTAR